MPQNALNDVQSAGCGPEAADGHKARSEPDGRPLKYDHAALPRSQAQRKVGAGAGCLRIGDRRLRPAESAVLARDAQPDARLTFLVKRSHMVSRFELRGAQRGLRRRAMSEKRAPLRNVIVRSTGRESRRSVTKQRRNDYSVHV
eukprot:979274-Pleurochrysis_carterae.AAC.1